METYLIAGLGNPGDKYTYTRHNAGFLALERLAGRLGARLSEKKFEAVCGSLVRDGQKLILMKPMTYMNLSGDAVSAAARYYDIDESHIIVLSDEVALPLGRMRIRHGGSAGGHNGLKDIIAKLPSDGFVRVRLGVGGNRGEMKLKDYVLGHFDADERLIMEQITDEAASAVLSIIDRGVEESMNRFNGIDLIDAKST